MKRRITDPKAFGRVGLVVGGDSAERQVSLDGGQAIAAALARNGIAYRLYDGAKALLQGIEQGQVQRVFNLLHGPGGEDGALQGALALLNTPVTGADIAASALSMDKIRSKWIWQNLGIPTPDFIVLRANDDPAERVLQRFSPPLFVKPVGQGSSIGVSKVKTADELPAAVALARRYGVEVMVEPAISGGEYFAGFVGDTMLPLIRIETPNEFYDYEAKYQSDETRYFCPCGLQAGLEAALRTQSRAACEALGVRGWGRVDFLLDEQQRPWFLEVNTTPGMTDHSLVPQAAAEMDIGFDQLVWLILETTLEADQ